MLHLPWPHSSLDLSFPDVFACCHIRHIFQKRTRNHADLLKNKNSPSTKPMHLFHDLKLMVWKQPCFILSSTDSHFQQPISVLQSTYILLILHLFCYVCTRSVSLPILPCKTTCFRKASGSIFITL